MAAYETQVVVIAGGPAGLAAAVQAAEDGAQVILVEKNSTVGGAANMGMGPLGIGTKYQKRQMLDISIEKAYRMFMEYSHYNVDGRLVKRYFDQSADTIQWLEDMGVEFEGAFRYFAKAEPTWHIVKTDQGIGPRAASFMNRALYNRALELGVKVLLETPAVKILKDDDGFVCGVLCHDKDGNDLEISCMAAIIATGGAGANPEFIKEQTGYTWGKDMFNFAIPGNVGDGIKMAWEAGVDRVPVRIEQAAGISGVDDLPPCVGNVMSQPNLIVNLHGKRIMDEEMATNPTFLSNAISHQKGRILYSIIDTNIAKYYAKNGVDEISLVRADPDVSDFFDAIRTAKESGNEGMFIADSIEELAGMLGIDPDTLAETIEEYNRFCVEGDEEFFKQKKYLRPITKAPFYAAAFHCGGYGTVGGIRINEYCEACDADDEPIPGLYAAGADACNIYDDSYMFLLPGNSMGFAVNTGRIAGMEAAGFVADMLAEEE